MILSVSVLVLIVCLVVQSVCLWCAHRMIRSGFDREKRWARLFHDSLDREDQLCQRLRRQTLIDG